MIHKYFKQAVTFCAYSYCAFILCYFILRLIFWDRLWIVAFIGTFTPLIFLPSLFLPLLAFSIIKNRSFSIISSIACILLVSWLHVKYFSPESISFTDSHPSLKILSHNVGWYTTKSSTLLKLIEGEQPEIVFLQETVRPHRKRVFNVLKTDYPYQIDSPPVGILSKYPVLSSEILHLANHPETQQRAIIKFAGQEIVIYNMQATGPWVKLYKILSFIKIPVYKYKQRFPEIQDLVKRVQQETLPVIVAGDFNMTDESQDYYSVQKVLQDAFLKSGFGFGFTWPRGFFAKRINLNLTYPVCRIDYIWHSKHWGAKSSSVLEATESDHLPVAAELVLLK
ncbi:endonuclease/exonuclease/phosphatase family protein [Microcoleus sp. herbarium19]|uniref:endonuclease/exonuclease/phosphatase family protein n=1 Tax=unclassified Microcoleus TaxID=2642155 RepID=UPI002FD3F354